MNKTSQNTKKLRGTNFPQKNTKYPQNPQKIVKIPTK